MYLKNGCSGVPRSLNLWTAYYFSDRFVKMVISGREHYQPLNASSIKRISPDVQWMHLYQSMLITSSIFFNQESRFRDMHFCMPESAGIWHSMKSSQHKTKFHYKLHYFWISYRSWIRYVKQLILVTSTSLVPWTQSLEIRISPCKRASQLYNLYRSRSFSSPLLELLRSSEVEF